MEPKLSIGIPVYNGLPYLPETLDSILTQTFTDFELVIIDNNSKDGTLDLCRQYSKRDKRIQIWKQSNNVGAAPNYNDVFRLARGQYFKWAAADDCLMPTYLERCVEILDAHLNVALCYPQAYHINETGGQRTPYDENLHLDQNASVDRFDQYLRSLRLVSAVFGVMRREVLAETQLIGCYPMSDFVLLAEVALRGQFYQVPERLFLHRMHAKQSIRKYRLLQDRAQWFQPGRPPGRFFPAWRVSLEFMKAIEAAPLSRREKLACYWSLRHWPKRYWKSHLRDIRIGVPRLLYSLAQSAPLVNGESTLTEDVPVRAAA
ncbi:glycosyltransferase family 2 protein [Calycomorphotria hydatis]|uniref:Spore coat polysaccharide biosynthesis protein SpsA n=1 Tax=Calycomorphotria hydatis TaxID=2528027 RepID=A0A517T653_9PLAN|nr:glycosyltransferase family 2 protein [Calycomorphotria hydatis]QDT63862.1 Spore coat polysaccharide biosynthesis protein SpsA [Calycomorphotria hydatis]